MEVGKMTEQDVDIPKISLSNTKKEMLEAFNLLKEKLQEKAKAELKPEKAKAEKKEKEIIETADAVASDDLIKRVNNLKAEVGKALSDVAVKLEEETERYNKIIEAIEVKNNELKEIFEIEKSAFAFAALLEAQKQGKIEFEEEMTQRKEMLEDEISSTKAEWEKEKQQYQEKLKEQKREDEKLRTREEEEYEYKFARDQELKKQKLADEIANLEKELQNKKEEHEKQISEKENELLQRDIAVSEREKLMNDLQRQVDTFPKLLEEKVAKAVTEATEKLKADGKKNEELNNKGFEGEKNVLMTKIESLENMVTVQNKQIENFNKQLENAYAKLQDVAVEAVGRSQVHHMTVSGQKSSSAEPDRS